MPQHPGAQTAIRLVIADDHAVVRRGLHMLLDVEDDFEVVAEAGDAAEARRKVAAIRPDVLVLDLNMPGESSLEAIPSIVAASPRTGIVVLTMQDGTAFARQALSSGALAYVLKEAADDDLVAAVRAAARGATYLDPHLGARLATEPMPAPAERDELSAREREVLRLIALGHTNAEIGDHLHLSRRTVESHRARLQHKLHRAARPDLVRYALESGLIGGPKSGTHV